MRHTSFVALAILASVLAGCHGSPTTPGVSIHDETSPLQSGRWSSGPACLTVTESAADLYSGCWHGHFARPRVSSDGKFTVEGTYRFEAGPVTNETGYAARFVGSMSGETLNLTVERTDQSIPPVSFAVTLSGEGNCAQLCL